MNTPRLRLDRAQLVVVDVQERLLPHISGHEQMLAQAQRFLQAARELRLLVTLSVQYPRGLGETVPALAQFCRPDERFEKLSFSCCGDDTLLKRLQRAARPSVLLVGIETHVCVQQTALDLLDAGLQPFVLADAVSSRRPYDHEIALRRMGSAGVTITTVEAAIYELMGRAGTEMFKRMLPIIK